jgi:pimeloyl-ACP methyl ester carboxylesterase
VVVLKRAAIVGAFIATLVTAGEIKGEMKDTVVLLHGIGHSRLNMLSVESALRKQGYDVINLSYPSRSRKIADSAEFVRDKLHKKEIWKNAGKIHFVSHSLGGLVIRQYLSTERENIDASKIGRVVMLGPPHGGSEVSDYLQNFLPYKWTFGPAGQELTTEARKIEPEELYYEVGIIAGTKRWPYPVASFLAPWNSDAHDGRVTVESTKLKGMKDHIVLSATHSFMSWKPAVHQQIAVFLKEGKFNHEQ